jgi:tRNA uridine 5-carboxymethylaminomethyl modification enzyme
MDLLTWPNVVLEQFHELIPALKHLEPSLKDRIMIEGLFVYNKYL